MKAYLVQIDARDAAGDAATLRFASHDDARLCLQNAQLWWPAIAVLPTLRHDFFDGDFQGAIVVPSASITLIDRVVSGQPVLASMRLADARIRIWQGELGADFAAFVLKVDGRISREPGISGAQVTLDFAPDARWLDAPLLATYAGTGGIEGEEGLAGTPKPLALGAPRFCPAVLIDPVDLVYQISGYGPISGVDMAFDRLVRLGAPVADHADLAALLAATIPNGGTATCKALGLIRHGAPADGQTCYHVAGDATGGWHRLPGAIIARIAGIAGGSVNAGSISTLNVLRPWPLSMVLTEQTTAGEEIQRIAASVAAVAGISWTGGLVVNALGIGTPSLTLNSDGSTLPPVGDVSQIGIAAPFWRLATQAEITHQVHSASEIGFEYLWRGAWSDARVYRLDDVVTHGGGATWRFVGATPLAGSEPAAGNANWQQLSAGMSPADIGAIVTVRHPAPVPSDVAEGSLYIDQTATQYRFEGPIAMVDDAVLTLGGSILLTSGYVRVQDAAIGQAAQTSNWSGVIDDDGDRPEDAADVTRVLSASPLVVTLRTKVGGDLYPDQLPVVIAPRFTKSGVLANATETWSFTATPGITATQDTSSTNERGKVTISAATASGTVLISVAGLTQPVGINLVQDAAGSAGGAGAASAAITSYPAITTGSYPSAPPFTAIVQSDASGHLRFSAYWTYAQGRTLAGKHVYRVAGSGAGWTDVAAESIGDPGQAEEYEPINGDYTPAVDGVLAFAHTLTSLTPSTDYEFGVMLRRYSSTGTAEPVGGSIGEQP